MSFNEFQIKGGRKVTVKDWGVVSSAMTLRGGLGGSNNGRSAIRTMTSQEGTHRAQKGACMEWFAFFMEKVY